MPKTRKERREHRRSYGHWGVVNRWPLPGRESGQL